MPAVKRDGCAGFLVCRKFNDCDCDNRSAFIQRSRAHLAPQQPSAVVLRRAPLGRRLGLLLIVAGVVVLDDVILPAEEGNNSCTHKHTQAHTHTHRGGKRKGIQS